VKKNPHGYADGGAENATARPNETASKVRMGVLSYFLAFFLAFLGAAFLAVLFFGAAFFFVAVAFFFFVAMTIFSKNNAKDLHASAYFIPRSQRQAST
jgi:hypothetical protein